MQNTSRHIDQEVSASQNFTIIGDSDAMTRVKKIICRVAESKADTVFIHGESGAGKELAARAIHEWSDHPSDPFVEINCASIPENLLESELFGYEKGAFTDAKDRKLGLFEIAGKGTVFLDEIGEMPAKLQAKLLRVIECRRFKRVGGTRDIEFSGRIVAATHRHLEEEIQSGLFRADLFYRLNVVPIVVPPLRDRKGDIPALVDFLLTKLSAALGVAKPSVSPDAMYDLEKCSWPGNVRELKNILQRTLIFHQPRLITPDMLELEAIESKAPSHGVDFSRDPGASRIAPAMSSAIGVPGAATLAMGKELFLLPTGGIDLEDLEKSMLVQALERSRFNQTKAAQLLHVTRHTLRYRLEKFGLLNGSV